MQLSIVIVSWNTCELLAKCIASVFANPPNAAFEVIVVDNASADGSSLMIREHFPQVHLIQNNSNEGFARANNKAIRLSTGHHVLLLNSDTQVYPDALEHLLSYMSQQSKVGAVGAYLLNADGTLQTSCYPLPTLVRELWRLLHLDVLFPFGVYRMDKWDMTKPHEVQSLLGACLMVRREALAAIGLLDEDYFFTGEEIDLCSRLVKAGWRIDWVPQAKVIHYGGQSSKLVAEKAFIHLYGGKILYFRKQHGPYKASLYKLILILATCARLLLAPLTYLEKSPQRQYHLVLATRYMQLLMALPRL